ncbi:ScbA/BarX family gamma-butyrolactone biosynthesis protein [Rhodococcus rhodochrous]|uniref:ScbA/BarX family gamma-butyrolactone biosynthesis protein n=1 Tax=Rhodococcus rhodochrous TaxID=1829 RepID=UPI00132EF7B7|nr:ScbA/BarX family gamma-butyrolactone biosynthesis protein [Rhodococcus rhodochrous]QHG83538.1 A-factor biosynthesis protein [Rhodococcus rhodochrous]QOH56784.1 A-factor biosynthesis protein [Rhodococcus rhodochrous]
MEVVNGSSGSGDDVAVLSFESTVPRRHVHRQAVSEVFLTDCVRGPGPDRFVLGAQWPRLHGFYRSRSGRYDPMLLAETLRQCVIYLAHTRYRVSLAQRFVMQEIDISAEFERLVIGAGAAEVAVTAVVSDVRRRGSQVTALSAALEFAIAGRCVGSGRGRTVVLAAEEYDIVRWGEGGPRALGSVPRGVPVDPAVIGVPVVGDVVVGATVRPGRWRVLPDLSHPVLFDHPSDHLPGMLVLEAARQAARAELGDPEGDPVSMSVQFHQFVELDVPAEMVVSGLEEGSAGAHVVLEQQGRAMATATLRWAARATRVPGPGCGG